MPYIYNILIINEFINFVYNSKIIDQLLFTPSWEVVPNSPQPAVDVKMVSDILINGETQQIFREIRSCRLENPTQEEVLKKGAQFLAETWPLLWKNL